MEGVTDTDGWVRLSVEMHLVLVQAGSLRGLGQHRTDAHSHHQEKKGPLSLGADRPWTTVDLVDNTRPLSLITSSGLSSPFHLGLSQTVAQFLGSL